MARVHRHRGKPGDEGESGEADAAMYRWIWDRLPGPSALRAAVFAVAAVGAALLVLGVISSALAPPAPPSGGEVAQIGQEDVVEPDGVRLSPRPVLPQADTVPIVPEDWSVPPP